MKIVGASNFDLETVNDVLVAENVQPFYIDHIVKALNEKYACEHSTYFFKSVEDDYKLHVFEP